MGALDDDGDYEGDDNYDTDADLSYIQDYEYRVYLAK